MKSLPISRSTAQQRARFAQIAFGVLGVGALGVMTVGLPWLTAVPSFEEVRPTSVLGPGTVGPGTDKPIERQAVHSEAISDRLMLLANHPVPPAPPEEPVETQTIPVTPAPVAEGPRFLGVIREPGRSLALVHVGGRQRIMAEGEEIAGVRLESISDASIMVSEAGIERQIDKQARAGVSISTVGGAAGGPTPPPGASPPVLGMNGDAAIDTPSQPRGRRGRTNLPTLPGVNSQRGIDTPPIRKPEPRKPRDF